MLSKHFKWDITGSCNLKCKHCLTGDKYQRLRTAHGKKELTTAQRLHVVDKLKSGGAHLINLLGGEPLVLGSDLVSIFKHCEDIGLTMTINTNGTLLTEGNAQMLFDCGCRGLTVSIEGPDSDTHDAIRGRGNFIKTVTNLEALAEHDYFGHRVSLTVNTVLTKHNMHRLGDMFELIHSLRADKWIILPLVVTGFASDNKEELVLDADDRISVGERFASVLGLNTGSHRDIEVDLQFSYAPLRKLVKHKTGLDYPQTQHCCMAGTTLGFVDPYGDLFPCDRLAGDFSGTSINGVSVEKTSLLNHDFDEIWNQPFNNELFRFVSSAKAFENYEPCNRCEYLESGLCIPCPLYGLRYKKIVYDFCLKAEKELGPSALRLDEEERKSPFRYSGQFEALSRQRVQTTRLPDRFELLALRLKKTAWVRENIQAEAAELYDSRRDTFFHLNYLGKEIWNRIDTDETVDTILNQALQLVPLTAQPRIYDSGLALVNELLNKDLIEVARQ